MDKGITVPVGRSSCTGLSLVELLVSIAILSIAVGLFAQVASYAFSHRSSAEKRTESHGFTQSAINSLYNVTFDELVGICSATEALDASPSDPCVNTSGVLIENQSNSINTTNLNAKQISVVKMLDSRLHIDSLTQLSDTNNLAVGCIHIASCAYIMGKSLLEVKLNYHWFNAVTKKADVRNVSFRRGIK